MHKFYINIKSYSVKLFLLLTFLAVGSAANAQNVLLNNDFQAGNVNWGPSAEIGPETSYGGTNAANRITEVDDGNYPTQTVAVTPNVPYIITFKIVRRQSSPTPATVSTSLRVYNGATNFVSETLVRSDVGYNYDCVNYIFTPTTSTVTVEFRDVTPGTSTYGNILDDVGLSRYNGVSISVATSANAVCSGQSVQLTGTPASTAQYAMWRGPNGYASSLLNPSIATTVLSGGTYIFTDSVYGCYQLKDSIRLNVYGSRLYVDSSVAASENGDTWARAVKTLSEALAAANSFTCINEIWVKKGTYYPMLNAVTPAASRDSSFRILRNGIKVYGGFFGNETALSQRNVTTNVTTLSGDIGVAADSTDNAYHVLTIVAKPSSPIDTSTRVDGFTIRAGNAQGSGTFSTNTQAVNRSYAGGLYIGATGTGNLCSPVVDSCIITRNTATYGGGVFVNAGAGGVSDPIFTNTNIIVNISGSQGGGVYVTSDAAGGSVTPVFRNCNISANTTGANGAGLSGTASSPATGNVTFYGCTLDNNVQTATSGSSGSALFFQNNISAVIRVSSFSNNTAANYGGALEGLTMQNLTIDSSTFIHNTTNNTGGTGGALDLTSAVNATITNSVFTGNKSGYGGAIEHESATPITITNCTFQSDSAVNYGAAVRNAGSGAPTVSNSRFLNNYSAGGGAGFDNTGNSALAVSRSVFSGNKGVNLGGVINNVNGTATFTNCVLEGNSVSGTGGNGGVAHVTAGSVTFTNSTLYNNTTAGTAAPNSNAIGIDAGATANLNNTIVWGAAANQIAVTGTLNKSYSNIKGIAAAGNNISLDPLFVNPASPAGPDGIWATADDGLRLHITSAAINSGNNALAPAGTDIAGATRIQGGTVDMGAYESSFTCGSGIVYVDSSKATSGDGTSWAAAFTTVTEGLTIANRCPLVTEVWVAKGTYYPMDGNLVAASRDTSFRILRNGIKVYGGFPAGGAAFAARDIAANPTILSGNIGMANDSSDNSYHVFTITTGSGTIDASTRLDGLIITEGAGGLSGSGGTTINGLGFNRQDGGGLYLGAGAGGTCSPTIASCTFSRNAATFGGGLYCNAYSNAAATCSPVITGCSFLQNRSISGGGAMLLNGNPGIMEIGVSSTQFNGNFTTAGAGGAVNANSDVTTYANCTFTANTSSSSGGALSAANDTLAFSNCTFANNTSNNSGGALTSQSNSLLTVSNCSFAGNTTSGSTSGGAIYATGRSDISQSTFTNNTSFAGGAIANYGGGKLMTITNSTFTDNSASTSGGALISEFQASIIVNGSRFTGNVSGGNGGVLYAQNDSLVVMNNDTCINNRCTGSGGAVMNNGNPAVITNSVFIGNRANGSGGGVYFGNKGRITGSIFSQDTAASGGGIYTGNSSNFYSAGNFFEKNIAATSTGGGINASNSQDTIVNCVFYGNRTLTANGGGGIFYSGNTTAYNSLIVNNTFVADTASSGGAIRAGGGNLGTLGIYNNISWKNSAGSTPFFSNATSGTVVTLSNNYESQDPLFVNESNPVGADNIWGTADDGLKLSPCSPAIGAGSNAAVPANVVTDITGVATRIQQTTVDIGAYESDKQPFVIVKSHTNLLCKGIATGSASVAVTGGSGTYTYVWAPGGATAATASNLTAGIYTVTITDASGCTRTSTDTLTEPATAIAASVTAITDVSCNGGANGSATTVASGGTGAYTYSWSPAGGTGSIASGLSAGTYTVTVTDANNCQATATAAISQPTVLSASGGSQTNVACNGGATGSATVAPTGGTIPYTYSWTGSSSTGATASGLSAGSYTVTVTDAKGCIATRTFNITQLGNVTAFISSQTNVSCNGGANGSATVTAGGGTGTYTYSWSPSGGTMATASTLSQGSYTVTVTDGNGCQASAATIINQPTVISALISSKTDVLCRGGATGSATVSSSGGTGPYTYSWTGSASTTATASNLSAGTYVVTVTDASLCSVSQTFTITEPATVISSSLVSQSNVSCFGASTGSATIAASGGTGTLSYSWNTTPVQTTATATGLSAGTYTVTITDANLCTATRAVTITGPASGLSVSPGSQTAVSCNGGTNGTATVIASGGTGALTYSWNTTPVQTTATATGLAAGTWTVTVRDANLCTATQSFTITQPSAALSLTGSQGNVSCNGGANGSATVVAAGGTPAYTYSWNTTPAAQTTATASGLAAGTYIVTVRDANLCQATRSYTITQPPAITAAITAKTDVSCNGGTNGTATVTASGGTGALTYSWNTTPVQTAATATGLSAGTYTVTVRDANLCQTGVPVTITQPSAPLSAAPSSNSPQCAGATLTIAANGAGGTAPYTYGWTGPGTFTAATSTITISPVSVSNAGTYNLTITDAKGCTATAQTGVVINTVPAQPGAISGTASVCGGSVTTYRVTPVATATSYAWTLPATPAGWTGASAVDSIRATAPGTPGAGTISVAALNGCGPSPVQTLSVSVTTIPATPGLISGTSSVCGGISRLYSITSVGQATAYAWTVPSGWSSPSPSAANNFINSTPPTVTGTGNGTITVRASNFCGTSGAASLAVTVTNIPAQPGAISGTAAVCGGTAQTYRIVRVPGAATYTWTAPGNGWTTAAGLPADSFINTVAGTGATTVTVSATNMCGTGPVRTLAVTVTNRPGAAGIITGPDSVCTGGGGVTFTTGAVNEATGYAWTLPVGWTGTSTTGTITGTPGVGAATGAVTITVAGTNGCGTGTASSRTIMVNNPVTPVVSVSSSAAGAVCAGSVVTFTATGVNGGASPLYQWRVNGVAMGGPTSSNTYSSSSLLSGDVVSVSMRTSLACATTAGGWASASSGVMVVSPPVTPGVNINATLPPDMCRDVVVTFYSNVTGGGTAPQYQWYKNGAIIPGAGGATYTDGGLSNNDTISVVLTSNAQCRTGDSVGSNRMGVRVSPYVTPVVTISVNPGTSVGAGQTVLFTAAVLNAGPNPEVRWKRNGVTVGGTTGLTWATSTLRDGDVVSAELVSGAQCATPYLVVSRNTLTMRVSTGVVVIGHVGDVRLYPNPTTGRFTVGVKGMVVERGRQVKIGIVNASGQLVYGTAVTPDTVDWSVDVQLGEGIANGVYLLRLSTEDGYLRGGTLRFTVNR